MTRHWFLGWFWGAWYPLTRFGQWREQVWLARAKLADKRAAWWASWTQRRLP